MRRVPAALALCIASAASTVSAQGVAAACDSAIATAKVGEAQAGIFLALHPLMAIDAKRARAIVANVGNAFVPPRPFRLSVFSGPSLVRGLRRFGGDSSATVRSPVVNGIYRTIVSPGRAPSVDVVRRSLIDRFDSAAVAAIRDAAKVPGVFDGDGAPLAFELAFTSDSEPGALRLFVATFPKLSVLDARALADSPPPKYPENEPSRDEPTSVVLRFVVAPDSVVEPATVEAIRAAPEPFMKAALQALEGQRFVPASVKGCPVAQQVDFPFAFLPPEDAWKGLTRRR